MSQRGILKLALAYSKNMFVWGEQLGCMTTVQLQNIYQCIIKWIAILISTAIKHVCALPLPPEELGRAAEVKSVESDSCCPSSRLAMHEF